MFRKKSSENKKQNKSFEKKYRENNPEKGPPNPAPPKSGRPSPAQPGSAQPGLTPSHYTQPRPTPHFEVQQIFLNHKKIEGALESLNIPTNQKISTLSGAWRSPEKKSINFLCGTFSDRKTDT